MRLSIPLAAVLAVTMPQSLAARPSANMETAKRVLLEKMGQGRFEETIGIYHPRFRVHGQDRDYSLAEDNESGRAWRQAVPDMKVDVLRTVASGDMVAVHWRAVGTNSVAAAGLPGKGGKANIWGMTFFRFDDGKIIEEWSVVDLARMQRQLSGG